MRKDRYQIDEDTRDYEYARDRDVSDRDRGSWLWLLPLLALPLLAWGLIDALNDGDRDNVPDQANSQNFVPGVGGAPYTICPTPMSGQ